MMMAHCSMPLSYAILPRDGKFAFGSYYLEKQLLAAHLPCLPSKSRVSQEAGIPHDARQPALSLSLESKLAGQRSYDLWGVFCSARPCVFGTGNEGASVEGSDQ